MQRGRAALTLPLPWLTLPRRRFEQHKVVFSPFKVWLIGRRRIMRQNLRRIRRSAFRAEIGFFLGSALIFFARCETRAASPVGPGLAVTFSTAGNDQPNTRDVAVLSNVQLYVPAGQPPTPFLP